MGQDSAPRNYPLLGKIDYDLVLEVLMVAVGRKHRYRVHQPTMLNGRLRFCQCLTKAIQWLSRKSASSVLAFIISRGPASVGLIPVPSRDSLDYDESGRGALNPFHQGPSRGGET